jgi:protein-S-isoprenylcysteine O-methyltransferase Ste14
MPLRADRGFLTRSGLRDAVILLSAVGAIFSAVTAAEIVVGSVLLLLGSFIHFLSKGVLIRNEVLCQEGIYRIVRHPYYLANYLIDSSFCLFSGNRYLVLLYPFLFFWSYGPTFRKEEGTLTEKHGDASVAYLLSTPPVFPDRHSILHAKALLAGYSFARISGKEVARIIRFYATALLILALHEAGGGRLLSLAFFSDRVVAVLLPLSGLLYGVSFTILKLRGRHKGGV